MVNMVYNTSLLLTVSGVHLLTPSSQHASVSPSAAYRAVRNSTQSVDSSPLMKRQRSLKVELVVSSPCHQIRGPRAAGDGARFLSGWLCQLGYQCGLISEQWHLVAHVL